MATALIASGMPKAKSQKPKAKIVIHIPFYGRAWEAVAAGLKGDGLHQSATTTASGIDEAGLEDDRV